MIGKARTREEMAEVRAKIVKLLAEGLTQKVIAARCSCGTTLISRVAREERERMNGATK